MFFCVKIMNVTTRVCSQILAYASTVLDSLNACRARFAFTAKDHCKNICSHSLIENLITRHTGCTYCNHPPHHKDVSESCVMPYLMIQKSVQCPSIVKIHPPIQGMSNFPRVSTLAHPPPLKPRCIRTGGAWQRDSSEQQGTCSHQIGELRAGESGCGRICAHRRGVRQRLLS